MTRAWVAVIVLLFWHIYRLSMAVHVLTSRDIGWRERVACRRVLFACPATVSDPQPFEQHLVFSRTERVISTVLLLAVVGLLLSACSSFAYPITTGSHASVQEAAPRYIVWSNHAGVGQYITGLMLKNGRTVVERMHLDRVLDEQRVQLSHVRDEEVLRIGHLAGATQVIFAEVQGLDRQPSVTVRSVSVESGRVQWSGSAMYPDTMATPDRAAVVLAYFAIIRATCDGSWEEPTATHKGGCQRQSATTQSRSVTAERSIWAELLGMEKR